MSKISEARQRILRLVADDGGLLPVLVKWATLPVLWLTICDACIVIYAHSVTLNGALPSLGALLHKHPMVLLSFAGFSIAATYGISKACRYMMRPKQETDHVESEDTRQHLHKALSAGLAGIALIVLEPVFGQRLAGLSFNLEELLLGISGLNMLMEEAKLARQYRSMYLMHRDAKDESEKLIKQIKGFRADITETFHRAFGE